MVGVKFTCAYVKLLSVGFPVLSTEESYYACIMKGALGYSHVLVRSGLSVSKNISGSCIRGIVATGLQDKRVFELRKKLFEKLQLPKID